MLQEHKKVESKFCFAWCCFLGPMYSNWDKSSLHAVRLFFQVWCRKLSKMSMKSKLVRRNSITVRLKTHFHYVITKGRPHKHYSAEAFSPHQNTRSCPPNRPKALHGGQISADHDEDDVTQSTKNNFFSSFFESKLSFREQWRHGAGIMGWFVPFLLPWDKQQLESCFTAQYLEQTIPSDCSNSGLR